MTKTTTITMPDYDDYEVDLGEDKEGKYLLQKYYTNNKLILEIFIYYNTHKVDNVVPADPNINFVMRWPKKAVFKQYDESGNLVSTT